MYIKKLQNVNKLITKKKNLPVFFHTNTLPGRQIISTRENTRTPHTQNVYIHTYDHDGFCGRSCVCHIYNKNSIIIIIMMKNLFFYFHIFTLDSYVVVMNIKKLHVVCVCFFLLLTRCVCICVCARARIFKLFLYCFFFFTFTLTFKDLKCI